MGTIESPVPKKRGYDCREFLDNMNQYTPKKVMEVSEMVHLACERIAEEKKEEAKAKREGKKQKK